MGSSVQERLAKLNKEQASHYDSENNEENFKKENWEQLTPEERRDALQKFENQNADEQGRDRREIVGEDLPENETGRYDHDENRFQISVNNDLLENPDSNPADAKNVVAHEGRHATQHDVVDGLIDGEKAGIDEDEAEELRDDFENDEHLDPHDEHNKGEYMNRASERDAREYASQKAPEATYSQEDLKDYEDYDSIERSEAYARQSAEDFERFENGEKNQFLPETQKQDMKNTSKL